MSPADARRRTSRVAARVASAVSGLPGSTVLLLIGPVLDRRAAATTSREFLAVDERGAGAACRRVRDRRWRALAIELGRRPPPSALLLAGGVTIAAAIALLAGPVVRLRIALRARAGTPQIAPSAFLARQLLAGVAVAIVLVMFARLLPRVVDPATVDLRHFSLHPWNATRLALLTGILACHAAALWTCTLILSAALARWRVAATAGLRVRVLAALDCSRPLRSRRLRRSGLDASRARPGPFRGWRAPSPRCRRSRWSCGIATRPSRRASLRCSPRFSCPRSSCIRLLTTLPKGRCGR